MSNHFVLIKPIARGAFGDVALYKRKKNDKLVVLKKIFMHGTGLSKEDYEKTGNEVKVLSVLNHPNIIQYHENFIENDLWFIVMEFAPGGNLNDFIQSRGRNYFSEEIVLNLFCQLASGLQHIHNHKIIHRDLKTHNVMLDRFQRMVKIGDFGISKMLQSKSQALSVVGTPCYLSPELCEERPYDHKSDIWSLGCILHELLALQRAFSAGTLPALITKIMRGDRSSMPDHYTVAIRNLVSSMVRIEPDMRPTCQQLMAHPLVFPAFMKMACQLGKISPND